MRIQDETKTHFQIYEDKILMTRRALLDVTCIVGGSTTLREAHMVWSCVVNLFHL